MQATLGVPRHSGGVVWIPVEADGHKFEIGAARPGDWNMGQHSPPACAMEIAKKLAEAYEKQYADELAPLFAEAEAFRASRKQ